MTTTDNEAIRWSDRFDRFVRWFFNSSPGAVIELRPAAERRHRPALLPDRRLAPIRLRSAGLRPPARKVQA